MGSSSSGQHFAIAQAMAVIVATSSHDCIFITSINHMRSIVNSEKIRIADGTLYFTVVIHTGLSSRIDMWDYFTGAYCKIYLIFIYLR